MTFANPLILWALILVPLAVLFLYWMERRRQADLNKLGEPTLIRRLSQSVNWNGR